MFRGFKLYFKVIYFGFFIIYFVSFFRVNFFVIKFSNVYWVCLVVWLKFFMEF